jgi:peptide/nickel transport system ATP-binding protein
MEPILKIENMNIAFQQKSGKKIIVENGEFEVNAGEFVLILGENGAGKSSIFRSIVQDGKTGERDMYFKGKAVSDIDSFRRAIGYASQEDDPESFFAKRVKSYIKDYVINSERIPLKDIDNAIDEVYKALRCDKYADGEFMGRRLAKCSGGEKRMASLLRALSRTQSKLFILDEPINNLDAYHARLLNNYLVRLRERENPPGILVITHCHMFQHVDRVYKLSKGKLTEIKDYTPKSCYGECNECGLYTEEE